MKNNERQLRILEENRIRGTNFDEILYADDTNNLAGHKNTKLIYRNTTEGRRNK